jgi:Family of unknown function (DUF6331)
MKLEHPLSELFRRCMTLCVAECCGIDAYDLHPVHIASFLIMYQGATDAREVEELRSQLATLKTNYGSTGASQRGATFEELNQKFSGEEVDALVDLIESNLEVALQLLSHIGETRGIDPI